MVKCAILLTTYLFNLVAWYAYFLLLWVIKKKVK